MPVCLEGQGEVVMQGYRKYFTKKLVWFLITFVVAVTLNFILPRLMPADPVLFLLPGPGSRNFPVESRMILC